LVDGLFEVFGEGLDDLEPGARPMSTPLKDALAPGFTFSHEYDYGDTTILRLRVLANPVSSSSRELVRVLARNDSPVVPCTECGGKEGAAHVCAQCVWDGGGAIGAGCARRHACGEEFLLPLVNSPRAGVCGYTG
jgi:hypothetical protein